MVFDLNEKKDEEQRFLDKVDEAIEKLPHTTTPLLEDLAKKICQTQSGFIRKECVKRMDNVLHWVTDTEHFSENTWGIYAADKIFRDFLISSLDPEKIKQCVSAYSGILTVMIKHSGPPKFKQDSLKQLLNELKEVVKPPQFCPYSRTRRDIEAVIKVMTNSVDNPKMLHNVGECIYKIEITKDGNQKNVIKLLNKYLKQKDWYQHFLIISWLKMQVT